MGEKLSTPLAGAAPASPLFPGPAQAQQAAAEGTEPSAAAGGTDIVLYKRINELKKSQRCGKILPGRRAGKILLPFSPGISGAARAPLHAPRAPPLSTYNAS